MLNHRPAPANRHDMAAGEPWLDTLTRSGGFLTGALGRRNEKEPTITTGRAAFVEYGNGTRAIANLPKCFGDVAIDHRRGTRPVLTIHPAKRPFGAAEAAFPGRSVPVQDLILGEAAVRQSERAAIGDSRARALVGSGKPRDFLCCQPDRALLVAAVRCLYRLGFIGSACACRRHRTAGDDQKV